MQKEVHYKKLKVQRLFDNKITIEKLDKISEQGLVYSYDKNTNSLNKNNEFLKKYLEYKYK